ncbi:MAG: hypothetical protein ACI90V_013801 [Bacillariaceae sp.]
MAKFDIPENVMAVLAVETVKKMIATKYKNGIEVKGKMIGL